MSRITTGLLYSIFGLRVPDDGTVTFYREIKLKMGFDVHGCYYDKIYLQLIDMGGLRLQRAIEIDRPPVLSTCPLHTNSGCGKERRILIGPW